MTDLIKRLGASCYLAFEDGTNDYSVAQEAIDRIEELEKELNISRMASVVMADYIQELTLQLLATPAELEGGE